MHKENVKMKKDMFDLNETVSAKDRTIAQNLERINELEL